MDIKALIKEEDRKKFLIIGVAVLLFIIVAIFFLTRTSNTSQTQILSDLSGMAPRDSMSTSSLKQLPTIELSVDHTEIAPGQSSIISWTAANATTCVDGKGDPLNLSGSLSVSPKEPYTFDINCTGPNGTQIQSVTVNVTTAPIINIVASPSSVLAGSQSVISWDTVNADRCVNDVGNTMRLSGNTSVYPKTPYTFKMSCVGPKGTTTKSVTVAIALPKIIQITSQQQTTNTQSSYTPINRMPSGTTPGSSGTTPGSSGTTPGSSGTTPGSSGTTPGSSGTGGSGSITITAQPPTIDFNGTSTISWITATGTKNCTGTTPTGLEMLNITPGGSSYFIMPGDPPIPLPPNGAITIKVLAGKTRATLKIRCELANGTIQERSITVTGAAPTPNDCIESEPAISFPSNPSKHPTITFSANPRPVESGTNSYVRWNVVCATNCVAHVSTWGEVITYVDTSKIQNYDANHDYNLYTNIHNLNNIAVNTSGGIRVTPGTLDPAPLTPPSGGIFATLQLAGQAPTVTLKCTNSAGTTTATTTKSIDIPIVQHPSCDTFWCDFGPIITVIVIVILA